MRKLTLAAAALTASIVPIVIGIATAPAVRAQTPAAPEAAPKFEVASIKPNKSGDGRVMLGAPGGRFTATNVPLGLLITFAYQIQPFQLHGSPSWLNSDRFDIVATADGDIPLVPQAPGTPSTLALMVRSLLADRFHLVMHPETREMPIYALVLARSDGKLGPNIKPAKTDCAAVARGRRAGGPPAPLQPGQPIDCGLMMGFGNMNAGGMPLAELGRTLSQQLGRVVLDKTGLTGTFDFTLSYAPEGRGGLPGGGPPGGPPPLVNGAVIDPNLPTLFTALQEQLGLKLDSQRGPVEMLVIDRVEQPTED
jgi:bla regulator protein blaR1